MEKILRSVCFIIIFTSVPATAHKIRNGAARNSADVIGCKYTVQSRSAEEGNDYFFRLLKLRDSDGVRSRCVIPYPTEVVTSREKWMESVVSMGTNVSSSCTKRILCRQACEKGGQLETLMDCPEILPGMEITPSEFEAAYWYGESQGYALGEENQKITTFVKNSSFCEDRCRDMYTECEIDMKNSPVIKSFYMASNIFRGLNIWFFSAYRMIRPIHRGLLNFTCTVPARKVVQIPFALLFCSMKGLEADYLQWAETQSFSKNYRYRLYQFWKPHAKEHQLVKHWDNFLESYNGDYVLLAGEIYQSLDYLQYRHVMTVMDATFKTYDFGYWKGCPCNEGLASACGTTSQTFVFIVALQFLLLTRFCYSIAVYF